MHASGDKEVGDLCGIRFFKSLQAPKSIARVFKYSEVKAARTVIVLFPITVGSDITSKSKRTLPDLLATFLLIGIVSPHSDKAEQHFSKWTLAFP